MPDDPLASWSDGPTKATLLDFIARVTKEGTADFVPPERRIATFDNDGTLWPEQPMYIQYVFAFDRVKALVPEHPEWKTTQPFQAVLEGDVKALAASGEKGLDEIIAATHSGMTTEQFNHDRCRLASHYQGSAVQARLYGACLSAYAGASRLFASQ